AQREEDVRAASRLEADGLRLDGVGPPDGEVFKRVAATRVGDRLPSLAVGGVGQGDGRVCDAGRVGAGYNAIDGRCSDSLSRDVGADESQRWYHQRERWSQRTHE